MQQTVIVVDAIFGEARLAEVYDPLDPDRGDLQVYVEIVEELGARSVLDVGCGTDAFACLLAQRGMTVTGVDPAIASLDVARSKPGADRVRWFAGDVTSTPPLQVDAATMTGNVAQVFVIEADGTVLTSDSTLRFRSRSEIEASLQAAGFRRRSRSRRP